MQENFVIYNEEYVLIKKILDELKHNSGAEIVFITDSEGHCIASTGDLDDSYLNSISSLIAGSISAVNSIAQMLEIDKFTSVLTESDSKSLYVSLINERTMLITIFRKESNLGLVRFRVKNATSELAGVFTTINEKLQSNVFKDDISPFEGVTDEDIDEIFGD
ncbi:MAG: roadblock/LC7 domain-containing protein [Acidobacteriota bacterium]|jgi:predicted regulator of Ras-like GTPase activity (Roadblock/LC7/MglB family)|nr:roadblock/LC7 domain-containing protein [Acidobacteriota bacterium]